MPRPPATSLAAQALNRLGLARPHGPRPFDWTARSPQAGVLRGRMQAAGVHQVRAQLRRQGLRPLAVQPAPQPRQRSVGVRELVPFTRQLSTLLNAGIPLLQSLSILGQGAPHTGLAALIGQLRADLEAGLPLSAALRQHPRVFPSLYAHVVEAGEASGRLDVLLDRLAGDLEKAQALRSRLRAALVYPAVVLAVAALVTGVVLVAVVPSFESVFASFGASLPAPTQWVMNASRFLVAQAPWLCALGVLGGLVAPEAWQRSRALRRVVERAALSLPLLGPVLHGAATARWSRTLSGLLAAGLPLVEAMAATRGATGLARYAQACTAARQDLARGSSLHAALVGQDLFSPLVLQMCAVGEESGQLSELLAKVADFHERELDDRLSSLSSLLEPALILLLGGLIGGLVLALYLPIFQMGQIV